MSDYEAKPLQATEITVAWDLILKIIEKRDDSAQTDDPTESPTQPMGRNRPHIIQFQVCKATLVKNAMFFRRMLSYREVDMDEIPLEDIYAKPMEIWLRTIHEDEDLSLCWGAEDAAVSDVWELIHLSEYLDFDLACLSDWFEAWKEHQTPFLDLHLARKLLLPCYRFNRAEEFAKVTRYLAYSCPHHIEEINPTLRRHLRLPHRILTGLNAAKGSLRTTLCQEVWRPMRPIVTAERTCHCAAGTYLEYSKAIFKTSGIFPLEEMYRGATMEDLLGKLRTFDYCRKEENLCISCMTNFTRHMKRVCDKVDDAFEGLSLDCIGDTGGTYWQQCHDNEYGVKCRVPHGRTAWYHSYTGRPDEHHRRQQVELRPLKRKADQLDKD